MDKLLISGLDAKYTFTEKASVIRNETRGGFPYYRNDLENTSISLTIEWILSKVQYNYFWSFYRTLTNFGALPFTMDLCINNDILTEYMCYFGNPQLSQVNGGYYTITDTLEVLTTDVNVDFDKMIVTLYTISGDSDTYLNLFIKNKYCCKTIRFVRDFTP